jgi:class 3 adenylate cyclase
MRAARLILFYALPLVSVAILGIFGILGVLQRLDGFAFDRFIRLRPAEPAAKSILLVDVDPQAGALAGLLADGLELLKEMDARYAVLDLPLAQKSPPALDPSVLRQTLPDALDREFSQMEENIQSLFDAIRRGSVRPRDAARYVSDLVGLVGKAKARLSSAAVGIERDDDALLGQAAEFFGRVYVPTRLLPTVDFSVSPELSQLALQRQSLAVRVNGRDSSFHAGGIRPAVLPVLGGARGGGFPSETAEPDGVRRNTKLFAEIGGQHIAQLAFAAVLDLLGSPAVEISPGRALLRGASLPGGQSATVAIPLSENGEMLLNWPRSDGTDGFRHLAWTLISQERWLEDLLVSDLRKIDAKGYLSYLRSPESLLDVYEEGGRLGRGMLAAGIDSDEDQWRAVREQFFSLSAQFLQGDAESRILADADHQLQSGALSEDEKDLVRVQRDKVPVEFSDARQVLARLLDLRESLHDGLGGSFCIVSLEDAVGSTPAPVTPFGVPATDAQVSAALVSTVLSGRFLRESPAGVPLVVAAVLSLVLAFAVFRLKPLQTLLAGLGAAAVAIAGLGGVFAVYGLFVAPSVPAISVLVTGIALASVKLAWFRGASRAIRAAFTGRVSAERLRVIDAARSQLALEGSRQKASVLCLAEHSNSLDSPVAEAKEVLRQLRTHRAAVREVILGLGGMVAGTGGEQIMAFFGAPVESGDHARRACLASLRLQSLERELDGGLPSVFTSRMGIHSGDCVAGFLGAVGLPEYSLVGPPVELAARLRELNGTFGTSIIITESLREAAGTGFQVRLLGAIHDKASAGKVRIYELLAEKGGSEARRDRLIAEFEEGIARYEKGDFSGALVIFNHLLADEPGDGPSAAYALRCRQCLVHPGVEVISFPW